MYNWRLAVAFGVAATLALASAVRAADDPTLLRVFLKDGTSLVSYGEAARLEDRVIFSMPTAAGADAPLHLVNIGADRVDWDRTNRYAVAARTAHYIATQAENDYARLSSEITQALNDVALTNEPARRLAIVERARQVLAEWPQTHYNYRAAEVRQMLAMLDEAIADLRAATGTTRFDLSFAAFSDPAAVVEPMLPPPTPQEAIEQVLAAARVVDTAAERTSLLSMAVAAINRDKAVLPSAWLDTTRASALAVIAEEQRVDRAYAEVASSTMTVAERRAKAADVRGLQRLVVSVQQQDAQLGHRRPEAVSSLLAAVEQKLDAARRLQLARDRWALRAPALQAYQTAIQTPMQLLNQLTTPLEDIKALSGSTPEALTMIERAVGRILSLTLALVPPEEVGAAHALLVSAVQLAGNAARIRRDATLRGDMARAWDASSAAAGALMLGARARADIEAAMRAPQPR